MYNTRVLKSDRTNQYDNWYDLVEHVYVQCVGRAMNYVVVCRNLSDFDCIFEGSSVISSMSFMLLGWHSPKWPDNILRLCYCVVVKDV